MTGKEEFCIQSPEIGCRVFDDIGFGVAQMETTHDCIQRRTITKLDSVLCSVHNTGVAAARKHNDSLAWDVQQGA